MRATVLASVAVSFLALLHATNGSLLGIDLGHQFFKVALVKPGTPFEIVTNVHTKRKTQSIVGFDNGERLFGGDAKTLSGRRPHLVFDGVRRLLGRGMDHPAVATMEKRYVGYGVQGDDERKTIRMSYEANGNKTTFSAEEVAAMTLMHGRANAEAFANEKDIKDVVLTVPSFYTQAERQAYLDAAKVAGFAERLAGQGASGLDVRAAASREACAAADVIVTVTPARAPLFEADWVRPGTHVAAMGADAKGKQELPPALLERAALFCDLPEQSRTIGEFQHASADAQAGMRALGDVLRSGEGGRTDPEAITVFDSSGIALQDLTIARAILAKADARL